MSLHKWKTRLFTEGYMKRILISHKGVSKESRGAAKGELAFEAVLD